MSAAARFDDWVDRGPYTARDLGLFRIVYAASALLLLPRPEAMSQLPAFTWKPPPGPLRLLDGPPPRAVLVAVTSIEIVALVLVLLGLWTTVASIAAGISFLVADGLANGYGSIHHYVLLGVVPLVVCWAGWGRRLSLDSRRRRVDDAAVPQWPLRLLAVCIAVAFATAGAAKVRAGWLDTGTQSTRAHFLNAYLVQDSDDLLAPLVGRIQDRTLWELLDWATVALELGLLLAVLSWALLLRTLPVVIAFHVVVLLVLNIAFAANVVAYAAFVRWSRWWPEQRTSTPRPAVVAAIGVGAAVVAWGAAEVQTRVPATELWVKGTVVLVAGVVTAAMCLRPRPARSTSG